MNIKEIIKSKSNTRSKDNPNIEPVSVGMDVGTISLIGSKIEDRKEAEERSISEFIGAIQTVNLLEESIVKIVASYMGNMEKENSQCIINFKIKLISELCDIKKKLLENCIKHKERKKVLEEIVEYLNRERISILNNK